MNIFEQLNGNSAIHKLFGRSHSNANNRRHSKHTLSGGILWVLVARRETSWVYSQILPNILGIYPCEVKFTALSPNSEILHPLIIFTFRLKLSSALKTDLDPDVYVDLDNYKSAKKKSIASTHRIEDEVRLEKKICKMLQMVNPRGGDERKRWRRQEIASWGHNFFIEYVKFIKPRFLFNWRISS